MSDQTQPPLELPLQVTMPLQHWRTLLQLLAETPFQLRIVGPIYGEIERQCGAQLARHQRGNGALAEHLPNA